ncbi:MAG: phosphatidylserine/phosphatidylglycerophosphate/cardiolipin synthase family protein [Nitrospinae bacterium]|nr:phosphatidylserine/phosphatidylglycerophosphate/cardiolipin synthase family protein [Nitrospinota bacterium]
MAHWDSEKIYFSSRDFYADIIREIPLAEKTIDVEAYIFEMDELGNRIAEELRRAAERGVAVRVLLDGVGCLQTAEGLTARFSGTAVGVKVYHPVRWWSVFAFARSLNRRNHRKSWVFDSRTAYVGSMNIAHNDWTDYGIRVEGKWIALLDQAFAKCWLGAARWRQLARPSALRRRMPYQKGKWIRLNDTLLKRRRNYKLLLQQSRNATQRIWLASAYFVPRLGLVRALCDAARRGVDVRIMVPKNSDVFFMPWLASTYFLGLLNAGVKIYEYLPSFYHAKVQVIDDWASLGSTNLNYRSLLHDLEADVVVTHPENRRLLEAELLRGFDSSKAVTVESLKETPWFQAIASKLFLLFRRWL